MSKESKKADDESLPVQFEGKDFYLENGFVVFTESYLRQRGYCCESGCRHCPYQRQKSKN